MSKKRISKLFQKEKKVRDTIITFGGMIFFQIINFVVGILIARIAGVADLGAFQFFVVTSTFFGFFAKVGIDDKISYRLPYFGGILKISGREFVLSMIIKVFLYSILSSIGAILFYFIYSFATSVQIEIVDSLFILGYLPCFSLLMVLVAVFRAENYNEIRSVLVYLVPSILTISIVMFFVYLGTLNKYILFITRIISYGSAFLLGVLMLSKKFNFNIFNQFISSTLKNIFKWDKSLYKWLVIALITFLIESGALALWIVRLSKDDYNIGIITILLRLASLTYLIPTSIGLVYGPQIAKLSYEGKKINKLIIRIFALTIFSVFFVGLFLLVFSTDVLRIFGKGIGVYEGELFNMLLGCGMIALTQPLQSISLALFGIKKILYVIVLGGISCIFVYVMFNNFDSIPLSVRTISLTMIVFGLFRLILLYFIIKRKTNEIIS